jgi:hypothetical protein
MADEVGPTNYGSIIKRTWKDPSMWARLMSDPEPSLEELGIVFLMA